MKPCKSDCVDPIWFGWLPKSTWQMDMMDQLKIVHQIQRGLALGMQSKRVADGSSWDEKKGAKKRGKF